MAAPSAAIGAERHGFKVVSDDAHKFYLRRENTKS
jgi:hypothetical protein